jgi:ATP-binding cassette subfamily F protein 3
MTRTVLGSFLFRGDAVFKPVSVLSGGEKTRLALVKQLLDPPNLLLMDEPTTHLDMASIDALTAALQQYQGTLVFISHDVHFIRSIANRTLHISAGVPVRYAGGYDYYLEKSQAGSEQEALVAGEQLADHRPAGADRQTSAPKPSVFKSKEQKRAEARARQEKAEARKAAKRKVDHLEREITALEERQRDLTAKLEDPELYTGGGDVMELNRELLAVTERLEELSGEWENAAGELASVDGCDARKG